MINIKLDYDNLEEALNDIELDHMNFVEVLQNLVENLDLNINVPFPFSRNVKVDFDNEKTLYEYALANFIWHQNINEILRTIGDTMTPPVIFIPRIFYSTQINEFLFFERLMHMDIDNFLVNL